MRTNRNYRVAHERAAGESDLVIRLSQPADEPALRRLADLDSRPDLAHGVHLLAERNGSLIAALPLAGGDIVADPFQPTADIGRLLELRARQLRAQAPVTRFRRKLSIHIPILGH